MKKPKPRIITTAIIKGGSGKTTTAAALAQAAAAANKKVLAIDLDPQANLSAFLGADPSAPGSLELLHGAEAAELIQQTAQGIDILTGGSDLSAEVTKAASAMRLREAIEPIKKRYDYIFIDTPPAIGELTFNALVAANGLIVPIEPDTSNLQGLFQIVELAQQFQQKANPDLKIIGTILTRFDGRPKINRYIQQVIAEKGEEIGAPLLTSIRPGIAIREAQALQQSLYDYAPKSNPAQDYKALFEML